MPWKRSSGKSSGQPEKSDCSGKAGMVAGGDDLTRNGWTVTGSWFGETGDRMVKKKTMREMEEGACWNIAGTKETRVVEKERGTKTERLEEMCNKIYHKWDLDIYCINLILVSFFIGLII